MKQKRPVCRLSLFENEILCSTIYADFVNKAVRVENHVDDPAKTAFGKSRNPDWQDFQAFVQERCIPRERAVCGSIWKRWGYMNTIPLPSF